MYLKVQRFFFPAVLLKASTDTALFCDFQNVSICRTTTSSALMGAISPREFVDVVSIKRYEDGTVLSAGKNDCVLNMFALC